MVGTIIKTLTVSFSVREVELLKELFCDTGFFALAEKEYGREWAAVLAELGDILRNA